MEPVEGPGPVVVVFSDYACPFCYLGKVAVDQLKREFPVQVEWRHIEIHPETPLDGIPRASLGVGYYSQAWLHVERLAAERGIPIHPSPLLVNTSFALIATEYARAQGRFAAFHDAVFRAYWLEGQNIGALKVLGALAKQVGLDPAGLTTYFKAGAWVAALEAQRRSAADHRVTGVPTVVIAESVIVGAQPYEVLREAVRRVLGGGAAAPA
ncbi:MAG: DsbA family oxidoreductase, partial [Anaerolineales bacterium]